MAIGEMILSYRKDLGMSQDELGQKLFVSRQTISLWEKNQTVPSIDNLMRLSEIFGVPVDEILGVGRNDQKEMPKEVYRFIYTEEELHKLNRLQRKTFCKKPILFLLICVFLIIFLIGSSAPDLMVGFAFGILFYGTISHLKSIHIYNKSWKNSLLRICKSTYEYKFFEKHIEICIYRNNEKIRISKCYYPDIEQIQQMGDWLFLQIGGQTFIIRKSELNENSGLYSYMYQNPAKTIETTVPNKFRTISIILFVASLLSVLGAIVLVGAVSAYNGLFVENMWMFYLLTPIPIASIVFGLVLKSKGYTYKKNIVAGIIMTLLLCIYGSFTFMF